MGVFAGSVPWFTMMILHKKSALLMRVDDTLAVFHTHAVAALLGGVLTGLLATPELLEIESPVTGLRGTFYGGGARQVGKQLAIGLVVLLRMPDDQLMIGDDAAHGEEAYALWGESKKFDATRHDLAARVGGGGMMDREGSAE